MLTFVETRLFSRIVGDYLSDEELSRMQAALAADPERGDIVPGSGGVRKLRWGLAGRGKRGGIRVIYYLRRREGVIWMLTIYAKNETANLPPAILRKIREEIEDGREA